MRHLVAQEGMGDRIQIDSAGTGDWHVGERPSSVARGAAWPAPIRETG